jgi:hypothetical protein
MPATFVNIISFAFFSRLLLLLQQGWSRRDAVQESLKQGVRLYDTAKRYNTEAVLGAEMQKWKSPFQCSGGVLPFLVAAIRITGTEFKCVYN